MTVVLGVETISTTFIILLFCVPLFIVVTVRKRLNSRPCPRCGERVKKGRLDCWRCKFDFRTVGPGEETQG